MAAAGAGEVQLSKGQTTAIHRLVSKEVVTAVVGMVSASAADSFGGRPTPDAWTSDRVVDDQMGLAL
jgi:hypothetical protein